MRQGQLQSLDCGLVEYLVDPDGVFQVFRRNVAQSVLVHELHGSLDALVSTSEYVDECHDRQSFSDVSLNSLELFGHDVLTFLRVDEVEEVIEEVCDLCEWVEQNVWSSYGH